VTPAASAGTAPAVKRGADRKAGVTGPGRPSSRARLRAAPRAPRRASGAARGASPSHSARPAAEDAGAIGIRLAGALASLSRHRLLDRLIGGRTWIAFVAFALIGIVTLQLGLLKLNGGIGRALEHEALLQRENAALGIEDSELAGGGQVQSRAARIGMELAPLGGLVFLAARPDADPTRAATVLATSGQPAAGSSEAGVATGASASAESGSAPSASAESASTAPASSGSASSGSASESSAAGAPAATSRPSEAASSSSPEASARPVPGASTPSGAEAPPASGPARAGGGEAASGGGTNASPSGG
jgi:hypothetical protein